MPNFDNHQDFVMQKTLLVIIVSFLFVHCARPRPDIVIEEHYFDYVSTKLYEIIAYQNSFYARADTLGYLLKITPEGKVYALAVPEQDSIVQFFIRGDSLILESRRAQYYCNGAQIVLLSKNNNLSNQLYYRGVPQTEFNYIYEDKDYQVYYAEWGEFGTVMLFKNKHTGALYGVNDAYLDPLVSQLDSVYYIYPSKVYRKYELYKLASPTQLHPIPDTLESLFKWSFPHWFSEGRDNTWLGSDGFETISTLSDKNPTALAFVAKGKLYNIQFFADFKLSRFDFSSQKHVTIDSPLIRTDEIQAITFPFDFGTGRSFTYWCLGELSNKGFVVQKSDTIFIYKMLRQ